MHLQCPGYVTWKSRIVFMRKHEHRMKSAFVKSTDARLVKSEEYGFSNREGQFAIAPMRALRPGGVRKPPISVLVAKLLRTRFLGPSA